MGKSLAIRLPLSVIEALRLREGDDIAVVVADERVFQVRKARQGCLAGEVTAVPGKVAR